MKLYISLLAILAICAICFWLLSLINTKNHYKNCVTFLQGRCICVDCINCVLYDGEEIK